MTKSEVRAEDYRGKARHSTALAAASELAHVREKHERASAVWTGLAELEERARPAPRPS